jgi:hypothetical protein
LQATCGALCSWGNRIPVARTTPKYMNKSSLLVHMPNEELLPEPKPGFEQLPIVFPSAPIA